MNSRLKLLKLKTEQTGNSTTTSQQLNDVKSNYIKKLEQVLKEVRSMEQKVQSLILDELQ